MRVRTCKYLRTYVVCMYIINALTRTRACACSIFQTAQYANQHVFLYVRFISSCVLVATLCAFYTIRPGQTHKYRRRIFRLNVFLCTCFYRLQKPCLCWMFTKLWDFFPNVAISYACNTNISASTSRYFNTRIVWTDPYDGQRGARFEISAAAFLQSVNARDNCIGRGGARVLYCILTRRADVCFDS